MNRRFTGGYWAARIGLNCLAYSSCAGLATLFGIGFSLRLYACAFTVYVILSLGDGLIERVWPSEQSETTRT